MLYDFILFLYRPIVQFSLNNYKQFKMKKTNKISYSSDKINKTELGSATQKK